MFWTCPVDKAEDTALGISANGSVATHLIAVRAGGGSPGRISVSGVRLTGFRGT